MSPISARFTRCRGNRRISYQISRIAKELKQGAGSGRTPLTRATRCVDTDFESLALPTSKQMSPFPRQLAHRIVQPGKAPSGYMRSFISSRRDAESTGNNPIAVRARIAGHTAADG